MISADILSLINEFNINVSVDPRERIKQKQAVDKIFTSQNKANQLVKQQKLTAQVQSKNNQFKTGQVAEAKNEAKNSALQIAQKQSGIPNMLPR
jgi:hypothetical protein